MSIYVLVTFVDPLKNFCMKSTKPKNLIICVMFGGNATSEEFLTNIHYFASI